MHWFDAEQELFNDLLTSAVEAHIASEEYNGQVQLPEWHDAGISDSIALGSYRPLYMLAFIGLIR